VVCHFFSNKDTELITCFILIENIKTEYHNLTFTPAQKDTEIVQAQLGNDAGITGAQ
jgi:hypothetical protein